MATNSSKKKWPEIMPLTKKDEEWLKQVYKECKKELGSFNLYQCWEKYLSGENKDKYWRVEGITGFVRWNFSKKYQANVVKDIAVLNTQRGYGYGKLLLQLVPVPVMLKCNADNDAGNAFYEKIGMKQSGVTHTKKGHKQIIWTCAGW